MVCKKAARRRSGNLALYDRWDQSRWDPAVKPMPPKNIKKTAKFGLTIVKINTFKMEEYLWQILYEPQKIVIHLAVVIAK